MHIKGRELQFDRNHHALYSGACRRKMLENIALHCPKQERAAIRNKVLARRPARAVKSATT